ncbi:hypothetical protein E1171_02165 [Cytophagales bacterium RKSG123]|nr:hypothetical protein [Xanthovirga aplysinae]
MVLTISSCQKKNLIEEKHSIAGAYHGIFERDKEQIKVNLELLNKEFTGNSNKDKFPAICRGTYFLEGNKIQFENFCNWNADFDWTLILAGDWKYQISNQLLILTNKCGDRYILEKK